MTTLQKVIEESKETFVKVRTDAISEMLDNVDEIGIYPTTKFFSKLDEAHSTTISKILSAIEAEVGGLPNLRIESIDHEGRKILWKGLTNKSDIQSLLKSAKEKLS
jgi:hypothetical protein